MPNYCVNNKAQPNGDHEVHTYTCTYFPSDRTYLGEYPSCHGAVAKAKETHSRANGCAFCSKDCHTS